MVLLTEDQPFTESSRDGYKAFFAQRGVNRAGGFLELAEYAVGGRRGLIIVPEGRDKRGWKRFAEELGKVSAAFDSFSGKPESGGPQPSLFPLAGKESTGGAAPSYAAVVSSGVPSSVWKRPAADVANGLLGFVGSTAELDLCPLGTPEISSVLRSAVDCYDLECGVDSVGKNLCGRRFGGSQCSSDKATEVIVAHAGDGIHRKYLECLNRFKFEIDRAFGRVKTGWQVLGLGLKPKTRKFLMPRNLVLKPKPLSKPAGFLGYGSKPGSGRSNPSFVAPLSTRRWFWFRRRLGFFRRAHPSRRVLFRRAHPSRRVLRRRLGFFRRAHLSRRVFGKLGLLRRGKGFLRRVQRMPVNSCRLSRTRRGMLELASLLR
ncbi:hypothetical protein SLA2020_450750 [Shorea laevis]